MDCTKKTDNFQLVTISKDIVRGQINGFTLGLHFSIFYLVEKVE